MGKSQSVSTVYVDVDRGGDVTLFYTSKVSSWLVYKVKKVVRVARPRFDKISLDTQQLHAGRGPNWGRGMHGSQNTTNSMH